VNAVLCRRTTLPGPVLLAAAFRVGRVASSYMYSMLDPKRNIGGCTGTPCVIAWRLEGRGPPLPPLTQVALVQLLLFARFEAELRKPTRLILRQGNSMYRTLNT
jgi:hypothetical protein